MTPVPRLFFEKSAPRLEAFGTFACKRTTEGASFRTISVVESGLSGTGAGSALFAVVQATWKDKIIPRTTDPIQVCGHLGIGNPNARTD
jgi:hypothetical protein